MHYSKHTLKKDSGNEAESETSETDQSVMVVVPKAFVKKQGVPYFTFAQLYTEYSRFHQDDLNVAIHVFFVPLILFSMMGLYYHFDCLNLLQLNLSENKLEFGPIHMPAKENVVVLNFVMLKWIICGIVYTKCDRVLGPCAFLAGIGLHKLQLLVNSLDVDPESMLFGKTFQFFLALHLFGWVTQIAGHGLFEQRAPALATNLLFMYIGPFFVAFEIAHFLFGYRSEEIKQLQPAIEADIAHYRLKIGLPMRKGIQIGKKH